MAGRNAVLWRTFPAKAFGLYTEKVFGLLRISPHDYRAALRYHLGFLTAARMQTCQEEAGALALFPYLSRDFRRSSILCNSSP